MDLRSNSIVLAAARAISYLPSELYFPRKYRFWAKFLDESEYWSPQQLLNYQVKKLQVILRLCAQQVPYYRSLFRAIGFDPDSFQNIAQLQRLPLLDRETVQSQSEDFLAQGTPPRRTRTHSTGGTMGHPMSFRTVRGMGWREQAFMFHLWKRVGFRASNLRAMLRGRVIKNQRHWEYDPYERAYVFSNFHMTPENVAAYAKVMEQKHLTFLHSYPSAVTDFVRHLQDMEISPPRFQAVLLSSENMYPGQRELIENFFQCRSFSWYGHTENLAMGGECEYTTDYHMVPQYGYLEIIKEDGAPATREGEIGEIVGTTLDNTAMPLLRYRTGDWAVVGPEKCRCGRSCVLLKEILGRWRQEMLLGKNNNLISMAAVNMHSSVFEHVRQFQFHQTQRGQATLRIVRKPEYTEFDSKNLLAALQEKIGDSLTVELAFVEQIPLTQRGKYRFIVQEVDVPAGMGGM